MKTPLTFQILLMLTFAFAIALGNAIPPRATNRHVVHENFETQTPITQTADDGVIEVAPANYVSGCDTFMISCSGTNYAAYIDAQPKEFRAKTIEAAFGPTANDPVDKPFMISNTGTIIMTDQGKTQEEIEASRKSAGANFNPVAPTWTPVE